MNDGKTTKPMHPRFALAVFGLCTGLYVLLAFKFPIAFIWATYEDLFGEWIQFWCHLLIILASVGVVWRRNRYRWFFALLALCSFYVAMEEISWGQRLIGFASPDFFKEHNLQGEANLHNFLTGPFATRLKAAIAYALAAALTGYGLFYPLAVRRRWRPAAWLESRGLAAPPLYLWPYFVTAAVLELGPFGFNEAEVAEVLVGLALVLMTTHYLVCGRLALDVHQATSWAPTVPRLLTARMAAAVYVVIVHAAITTLAVYATPSGRERIEARIENGIEKFAGRYKRYGQHGMAVKLYERLRGEDPDDVSNLRRLAESYRQAGDTRAFDKHLGEALEIDLKRFKKDPEAASVHRSLVRTYQLLGHAAWAQQHLDEALRIGLGRIEKHPRSASAAYSLGLTYDLMDRPEDALKQYRRAVELEPTSKTFNKAYLKSREKG